MDVFQFLPEITDPPDYVVEIPGLPERAARFAQSKNTLRCIALELSDPGNQALTVGAQ